MVAEAVELFLAAKSIRNSTRRRYGRSLRPLADFAAARGLESLDAIALEDLDRFKLERNVSAFTWSKELETIRSFFRFSVKRRWCTNNPAAEMEASTGREAAAAETLHVRGGCSHHCRGLYLWQDTL